MAKCCPRCTDGGFVATEEQCPECMGQPFTNLDGHTITCGHCHGTGKQNIPCPECAAHEHKH